MAFDISALTSAFRDQLDGGEFYTRVGEGTLAQFFNQYEVKNKGTQQLNVNNANLSFTIDVDGDIDAYDTYASNLNFGKRDLTVDGIAAQGYVATRDLYGSYAANSATSGDDESVARKFTQHIVDQASYQYAKNLYTGFGTGTPTNGLSDIVTSTVATGSAALSSANAITKIEALIEGFLAVSGNDALENSNDIAIILRPAHYRALRAAYRTENYFDTDLVAEGGMMVSRWLDDSRISIYGDPAYTGEPMIVAADSVFVGRPSLTDLDNVEFWYNPDKKAVGYRIEIWGGVQILEAGHGRISSNA